MLDSPAPGRGRILVATLVLGLLVVVLVRDLPSAASDLPRRAPTAQAAPLAAGNRAGATASGATASGATAVDAVRVLRAWDRRRSAAYASGDRGALAELYVRGSEAAAADLDVLGGYLDRGLTVRRMRTQLLAVRVLASTPRLLRVRVVDRLQRAEAWDRAGEHVRLPADHPSTWVVTLRATGAGWRVSAVRPRSGR